MNTTTITPEIRTENKIMGDNNSMMRLSSRPHRRDILKLHVVEQAVGGEDDDVPRPHREGRVDGVSRGFEVGVVLQ